MPPARVTIIIDTTRKGLEEYYHLADETLQEYYDRSPTSLIDIPMSEKEKGDIAYYNTLAEQIAKNAPASNVPNGKRVI